MKKLLLYFTFSLLLLAISCDKDSPEHSPKKPAFNEPPWKKFIGRYQVENLNTGEEYDLHIGHKQDTLENGFVTDSLVVTNFDNNFNYSYVFKYYNDQNYIQIIGHFGIRDKNNNRWAVYTLVDDTTTTIKENMLINDTIIFYIRKSNIAFWQPDGTWYYDCYCKHLAVKVSDD